MLTRALLVLTFTAASSFAALGHAQTIGAASDLDYAILLGISEAVEADLVFDAVANTHARHAESREQQTLCAEHLPAVPTFAEANTQETPELSRLVQLATAHRLRGETIEAAAYYAQVVQLSPKPIHLHFFAECARTNGDRMLADRLAQKYAVARVTATEAPIARPSTKPVRLAGVITHATTGTPLRGVSVRVLDPISLREHSAITDANGLFVVDGLTSGATLTLQASLTDFVVDQHELLLDAAQTSSTPIVGMRIYLQPDNPTVAIN